MDLLDLAGLKKVWMIADAMTGKDHMLGSEIRGAVMDVLEKRYNEKFWSWVDQDDDCDWTIFER